MIVHVLQISVSLKVQEAHGHIAGTSCTDYSTYGSKNREQGVPYLQYTIDTMPHHAMTMGAPNHGSKHVDRTPHACPDAPSATFCAERVCSAGYQCQ